MLKYPILNSLSAMSYHLPVSVKRMYSVSGEGRMLASQLAVVPLEVSQKTFLPLIMDSGSALVSITATFSDRTWNSSAERGLLAFSMSSLQGLTPIWLSLASQGKYLGGLDTPAQMILTNQASSVILNILFLIFWFSMEQKSPAPMAFPQAEPLPWPGQTRTVPSRALSFLREAKRMAASSWTVASGLTARSGLPTSPKKSVSPVNTQLGTPALSLSRKLELSEVCPGVWMTWSLMSPSYIRLLSSCSLTSNLLISLLACGPMIIGASNCVCPERKSA